MVTGKNRFVFVCPMYNAGETLSQTLYSLYGQSYKNWRIILIDDVSDDSNRHKERTTIHTHTYVRYDPLAIDEGGYVPVREYSEDEWKYRGVEDKHVTAIFNREKRWEVANVLAGIKTCEDDDIVCRIDADDYLVDLDALAIIDQVYNEHKLDALWTAHRWGFSDHNISAPMPDEADPYCYPWVSSHLKTFRKRLINGIPIDNFKNMEGKLVQRAGDQAIYLPVLHRAKKRAFLPRVTYHYTIDVQKPGLFTCDDSKFQKAEADFIRNRGFIASGIPWEEALQT